MKIFVCAKQVPDTTSKVYVKPDGTLDRAKMRTVTNPDDLAATEAALVLKERFGATVTVVTMGPPRAEEMLYELLAMGADDAVLVTGRSFAGSDTYATSRILAAAIRTVGFGPSDLILCGQLSIDGDTAQVGPELAECLGIPQMTFATAIEAGTDALIVTGRTDTGTRKVRLPFPCLVACTKDSNTPRYPSVDGIFSAYGKPLTILDLDALSAGPRLTAEDIGLAGSPTNSLLTFAPAPKHRGTMLDGADRKTCETLASILAAKHLL